jgi:hypothetical protein
VSSVIASVGTRKVWKDTANKCRISKRRERTGHGRLGAVEDFRHSSSMVQSAFLE